MARRSQGTPDDGLVPLWGALVTLPAGTAPDELYHAELARALPAAVERAEEAVGARATAWQLRAMSTRWGSCTPRTGRIRVNVRLAAYPPTCLDYVLAHELTHLLEPSHNQRFHVLLARAYPNERAARALLRREARELAATGISLPGNAAGNTGPVAFPQSSPKGCRPCPVSRTSLFSALRPQPALARGGGQGRLPLGLTRPLTHA